MKVNYEQIVKAHQNQPGNAALQVSDEVKFQVVCDSHTLHNSTLKASYYMLMQKICFTFL